MTNGSATEHTPVMSGGVDVHAHWFPAPFLAEVAAVRAEFGGSRTVDQLAADQRIATAEEFANLTAERLRLMDEAGIATQILSYSAPHVYHPTVAARERLVRSWNDATADAAASSGGRFHFFATLPLPFASVALREIERVRGRVGLLGFAMPTHIDGGPIDDPEFAPVFDAINEGGDVVFLHPDGFCVRGALEDHAMEWTVGAPFEDTIAALRLVNSHIVERCPDIRFVLPHLGGTLPFLLSRIDRHWSSRRAEGDDIAPSTLIRKLYFDTAQSSPAMLAMAAETLGADHLVFGTDFPYMNRTDFASPARDLLGLGEEAALVAFHAANLGLEALAV